MKSIQLGADCVFASPYHQAMDHLEQQQLSEFAERLAEICDDNGLPQRGRPEALASIFNMSAPGARRWLQGEVYPRTGMMAIMAKWARVNFEWLATGRGAKPFTAGDNAEQPTPLHTRYWVSPAVAPLVEKLEAGLLDQVLSHKDVALVYEMMASLIKCRTVENEPNRPASDKVMARATMSSEEQEADLAAHTALLRAEGLLGEPVTAKPATTTRPRSRATTKTSSS